MVTVSKAKRVHIPQIVKLWKDFMDFHAALDPFYARRGKAHIGYEKHLMKSIGSPNRQLFVALDGKRVIGYAYAEIMKYAPVLRLTRYGYISDLYIDPACRRRGVGESLYNIVREWFVQKGLTTIELGIAAKNGTAESFWRKLGFRERFMRMHLKI